MTNKNKIKGMAKLKRAVNYLKKAQAEIDSFNELNADIIPSAFPCIPSAKWEIWKYCVNTGVRALTIEDM